MKLIDYGRAMMNDEKISLLLGTPVYMAPEIHSAPRIARVSSDLYSLGLVALEMLRGERIFDPRVPHPEAELQRVKMELPEKLYDLLPEHVRQNQTFYDLMRRFLAAKPEERFASAEEADACIAQVHKQLTLGGMDSDYGRELQNYLSKIVNPLGPV